MPEKKTGLPRLAAAVARFVALLAAAFCICAATAGAGASTLDRAAMEKLFPKPFIVGERDATLPIWPIFRQSYNGDVLAAYAFESIDFEPIPGFSGTPIDLLVAVKPSGELLDVRVLSQHEPVFVDGLGPEPLMDFVKQYAGKSIKQSIKIVAPGTRNPRADSVAAEIDGVAKATASVRIINETIIESALQVARARLGFSKGRDPNRVARPKPDVFEPLTFQQMLDRGYIRHLHLTNAAVEKAFKGSDAEGLDEEGLADPTGTFADVYIAEVDVPVVGRNLLGEKKWRKLMDQLDGAPAMFIMSSGRWTFMPDSFIPGSTPDFIALSQANAPVAWRDFVWRDTIDLPVPKGLELDKSDQAIMRIAPQAAFDPASPSTFSIRVLREKGQIFPEHVTRDFKLAYSLRKNLFILPPEDSGLGIDSIWESRIRDIAILGAALIVLAVALARQHFLVRSPRNFKIFRLAFLAFTLVFIGWIAQAQLSIVWLFGLIKAIKGEGSFVFFLWDPPTLMVTIFALVALFVWGRGTFCGWLCPFGALQEFAGELARLLRLRQFGLPQRYERLSRIPKFLVLAVILVTAVFFTNQAEKVAEVEPFKTSITLIFMRSAPFVLYAVALLIAGMFHYKFFCRYLCPLGATLAALSFVRRWKWIPRRKECGAPCQMCRVKCRYGAIERSGEIVYSECFQCMDCVVIHDSPTKCVPLVLERKRARKRERQLREAAQ
ncbi:4Fe-4S binding protein [Rhodoblastus acidophilus]|uniref:4Fe-4S binding protein n=1 Tax=Candidatus Rhodoblastus alkanivorans TaxID=2954117 RepID=A0ABS9Z4R9_9HYPH|nr:4Fe-4S binding protein [Candidatus Rhodoblastus alkanivorans]MCI4677590.1 4Fe-4S binding protein [Candidatus Rhodoblastus alkanivorans]MCI4682678.1 4Fe-4S binding protein [Candidatus Rhodoblastus alkanivorans]MDI4639985.1 4Fe-4S binding protein [Rhodoblastus acidophilus]